MVLERAGTPRAHEAIALRCRPDQSIVGALAATKSARRFAIPLTSTTFPSSIRLESIVSAFRCRLADELSFSMSREQVRSALGAPSKSGGGVRSALLGRVIPPWDRYDLRDHSLHLRYTEDGGAVAMVTLMAAWRVPA